MAPEKKASSSFFIGLALFSMFFGSGNLIFPLFVGQLSKQSHPITTLGFLLSAVLLPFLGILAMVVYRGDYMKFFSSVGKKIGFILAAILLTVWIPLGSSPRCITLAYATLSSYFSIPPFWIVSLFYCAIVGFLTYKKSRMLSVLGYVLTPLLLCCLAAIVIKGLSTATFGPSSFSSLELFTTGLKEGYNTMDLIAAFFFSASIIAILRTSSVTENGVLKKTLQASLVGILTLAVVYIGLIALSAGQAHILEGIPKDKLLITIAKSVLGEQFALVAAFAVILACLTTSVALVVVFADFLQKILPKKYPHTPLILTLIISFVMSLFGLQGITIVTEPVLQVFYPLLAVLIVWNVSRQLVRHRRLSQSKDEPPSARNLENMEHSAK